MTSTMENELIAALAEAPEGSGIICVTDHTGDTRQMWDPRNKDEVAVAKAAFDAARSKGMLIYAVDPETGGKAEVIRGDFDKKLGKVIIAVPQPVGG